MPIEFPFGGGFGEDLGDQVFDPTGFTLDQAARLLGVDIGVIPDLDTGFALVSGYRALGEAIARRLETPRGGLFYDADYGTDIRGRLNDSFTQSEIFSLQSDIEAEVEKEERVQSCAAAVTFNLAGSSLSIGLTISTAAGPFRFVLSADALTVQLLSGS